MLKMIMRYVEPAVFLAEGFLMSNGVEGEVGVQRKPSVICFSIVLVYQSVLQSTKSSGPGILSR